MRVVFILILITFSCSRYQYPPGRMPAASQLKTSSRILLEGLNYLKDYRPGAFKEVSSDVWLASPEASYRQLGRIDRGLMSEVPPVILSMRKDRERFFSFNNAEQIPYEQWLGLSSVMKKSFNRGHHVFEHQGKLYTLFGVELSSSHIRSDLVRKIAGAQTRMKQGNALWSFFNGHHYLKLEDQFYLEWPMLNRVSQGFLKRVRRDAVTQIETLKDYKLEDLLNYRYDRIDFSQGEWRDYFHQKEDARRRGSLLADSYQACPTQVYLPGISEEAIAFRFVKTLIDEKPKLMDELRLTNNQYNELMAIAVGVLLVETKMGRSLKYALKEGFQFVITLTKRLKGRQDHNSRGLTQIKDVASVLKNSSYEFLTYSSLNDPKVAAIATMFVLREKLQYLRHFQYKHAHINLNNWPDYLYYFYQGASAQVTKGTATPKLNLRIRQILLLRRSMALLEKC